MQSLWMLLACAMFAMMGAFVKVAASLGASLPEIVLFRGVPSVLLLLFWVRSTHRAIRPTSWRLHVWRNVAGITSMWLGFYALFYLPLPTATSLNYTAPLFIAGWLLVAGGAQRDPVRILAVVAGFLGVLGVLRPSITHDQWFPAFMGLGAGALAAIAMMQIRQLGRIGEPEWLTVLLFSCGVVISSLVGLSFVGWHTHDPLALLSLTGLGSAGLVGQLAMTRAFGLGSTLLTAALQYMTIIFAALIGVVFWGDRPAFLAWAGIALIIGSGLLSIWRTYSEARMLRGASVSATAQAATVIQEDSSS
ncbi:MAG TPA: DMT family transporter [Castellaniella sp.]|uniref:DMT family transporter n=1 Tax=Castellaniella sp. TaxID=1955812 RepID=UPI002F14D967